MKRTSSDQDPSRALLSWLNTTLHCQQAKVEQLGNGLAYCLLLHHFYPMEAPLKRVCLIPRRLPDCISNLRYLTQVLGSLKWHHIGFDINKVAANSHHDNLQLLTKLHAAITKAQATVNRSFGESLQQAPRNAGKKVQAPTSQKTQPALYNPSGFGLNSNPYHQHNLQLIHMGLATPLKASLKSQPRIKSVIGSKQLSDRQKIKNLKQMLEVEAEGDKYSQEDEKDLLSDDNKKDQTIVIDDA